MKILGKLYEGFKSNVLGMRITGWSRWFLYSYAALFIVLGVTFTVALCKEFIATGSYNYKEAINFARAYFGPEVVATMVIIGVALIDKDGDGGSDVWEEKAEGNKENVNELDHK